MAEKKQPWGKFYWGDWRKDARLRLCGYAARGLWADMLSLMGGECDEVGFLIMEGKALGAAEMASLLGGSTKEMLAMLAELRRRRVYSMTGDSDLPSDLVALIPDGIPDGVIFSRRMLRDKAKAAADKENGGKGGNPKIKRTVNQGVNPEDKAQKPEARDQKPDSLAREAWSKVWAAFKTWPGLPAGASEQRTRAAWERLRADMPADLARRVLAHGEAIARDNERRGRAGGALVVHPHNWLERDRGWEAYPPALPATEVAGAAWGAAGAVLCEEIGPEKFRAWFGEAKVEMGPRPRIVLPKEFQRKFVAGNFSAPLKRAFGCEVILEAMA